MTEEQWLDDNCPTEFVDAVDGNGFISFGAHYVKVPDNIAAALRVREHRIVQFKPIVIKCGCRGVIQSDPRHCDIRLEIHDNGDLIMRGFVHGYVKKVSVIQVSAVCDAYYPDNDEEEFGL